MTSRRDALKMMAVGGAVVWTAPMIHTVAAAQQTGSPGPDCTRAQQGDTNLAGADLTSANLTSTNLTSANLAGADLTSANLTSANLTSANLTSANLTGANLTNAPAFGVNFTDANLTSATLTAANLMGSTGPSNGSQIDAVYSSTTTCSTGQPASASGNSCIGQGPGW